MLCKILFGLGFIQALVWMILTISQKNLISFLEKSLANERTVNGKFDLQKRLTCNRQLLKKHLIRKCEK